MRRTLPKQTSVLYQNVSFSSVQIPSGQRNRLLLLSFISPTACASKFLLEQVNIFTLSRYICKCTF